MISTVVAGLIIASCFMFFLMVFGSLYFWERNKRSKSDGFHHTAIWCMLDYMWDHSDESELRDYAWHLSSRHAAHDDEMRMIVGMIEDARPEWYQTYLDELRKRVAEDKREETRKEFLQGVINTRGIVALDYDQLDEWESLKYQKSTTLKDLL